MKKIILAGLLSLSCLGGLCCLTPNVNAEKVDALGSNFGVMAKNVVQFSANEREKPKFEAYTEVPDENGDDKYKFYFFNVGEIENVPISIARTYQYSGYDFTVQYTVEVAQEMGIQQTLEKSIQNSTSHSENLGYVVTKGSESATTHTSDYTYGQEDSVSAGVSVEASYTVGAEAEVGAGPFAKASANVEETISAGATVDAETSSYVTEAWGNEFSETNSVEAATSYEASFQGEQSTGIANAYMTYANSEYHQQESVTISFNESFEHGYYRWGLFARCELYYILCVDIQDMKVYTKYYLYPAKDNGFSYGLQHSSNGHFDEELEEKITVNLNDVVDYLNFDPAKNEENYRQIRFDSNGGTTIPSQTVEIGEKVAQPEAPTRFGYSFAGWYTDEKLTKSFDFATKVTEDVTLYAKWDCDLSVECLSYTINTFSSPSKFPLPPLKVDVINLQLNITNNCSKTMPAVCLGGFDLYMDDLYLGYESGSALNMVNSLSNGRTLSAGQSAEITFACFAISSQYQKLVSHLETEHEFRLENIKFIQGFDRGIHF